MTKKEKIFQAALHLFVENGIDKTPTAKIASEAGVATGTLFHHFKSKEELVNALYLDVKASIAEAMSSGVTEIEDDKSRIHHAWKNFIDWSMNNSELFKFNMRFCESPVITKNTKQQLAEETFRFLSEILRESLQNQNLRKLPIDFLASLGTSLLSRTAQYFIENPELLNDPILMNEAFEAFWGMLVKQE